MGPVAIVGVGLMGGSLGLALRARGRAERVRASDPDPDALARALERGAITEAAGSLEEAVRGAEAVFLAAPVGRLPELARRALAAASAGCVVSDLGSTKASVMSTLDAAERSRFIGGHPICGSERTGVESARAELFEGATWFLTPAAEARPELFQRLHATVSAVGARPVAIDPDVHDRLMALVSHLPHVLAAALIDQAAATAPSGREALRSAGPSFTDVTRVAGSNPLLWTDILLSNRHAVAEALDEYGGRLAAVARALRSGDGDELRALLERARDGRGQLRAASVRATDRPWTLLVSVPDRPGAISAIVTALGHAHINIEDLRLRPGPPEAEGELRLVVDGEETARRAAELVSERGYRAQVAPGE